MWCRSIRPLAMTSLAVERMNNLEKLAIAQATMKVIGDVVSTKNPDSLRSQIDAEVLEDYRESGIKSRDLRVNGEKVGTYSVRVAKPKTERVMSETDHEAFVKWAGENPELCTLFALNQAAKLAQFALETAGELPDGYKFQEVVTPERTTGTTLKVDVQSVAQAMGNELPSAVAGLLEGGR